MSGVDLDLYTESSSKRGTYLPRDANVGRLSPNGATFVSPIGMPLPFTSHRRGATPRAIKQHVWAGYGILAHRWMGYPATHTLNRRGALALTMAPRSPPRYHRGSHHENGTWGYSRHPRYGVSRGTPSRGGEEARRDNQRRESADIQNRASQERVDRSRSSPASTRVLSGEAPRMPGGHPIFPGVHTLPNLSTSPEQPRQSLPNSHQHR
ncbi:hypothetical protein B0H13DRAFT_2348233 [Mycena leptocephala]|nr:hypothetical protein B0H13DRAFT_2348233 [Mycena leptocephala]